MTDLRTAANTALYALEFNYPLIEDYGNKKQLDIHHEAIMALHKALTQPEQDVVPFPSFMRRRIEQAMKDAIHPKGMSVHVGKVKVLVSDLHRMLLVIDSVLAQPDVTLIDEGKTVQEPVAWMFEDDEDNGHKTFQSKPPTLEQVAYLAEWKRPAWTPLYTAPLISEPVKERISEPLANQEPVAYADALDLAKNGNWDTFICKHSSENHEGTRFKIPLYTTPPRKPWVGLTDDELNNISEYGNTDWTKRKSLARAIEAKLKERNT
jgi:hypothetical protein